MASVDGITVAKAQQIQDASVVSGFVDSSGTLFLVQGDGTQINAGQVADYAALQNHIDLHDHVHGATGTIVGTSDLQTLTQKTLITPTIASFANAQHDHNNATAGGGLYIGKADSPAPITSLTAVNLSDGDPAKTMASISCPPGRWLILATCEGVNLGSGGVRTRHSYDLKSNGSGLVAKPVSGSTDSSVVDGGKTVLGWLENTVTSIISFTLVKNGTGGPIVTNSTVGQLVAVRMG